MLLVYGADPEAITYVGGHTALFEAAVRSEHIAAKLLVELAIGGADIHACRMGGSNIEEFMQACRNNPVLTLLPTSV